MLLAKKIYCVVLGMHLKTQCTILWLMAFSHGQTLKIQAGLSLPSSLISVSDLCPSKECPL